METYMNTYVLLNNSDSEGRWFESSRAYMKVPRNLARFRGFFVFEDRAGKCMRYMVGVQSRNASIRLAVLRLLHTPAFFPCSPGSHNL